MVLSHSQDPSGNWSIVLGFISLVTRVLAPSICFIIVNVGSGPVLTAGEPLCEASAVPALRSEPAQSCCSADSAAPSLSPAPGRTLQEGGRKGDSVSYCICCCSCWNETQNTAGVFLMEFFIRNWNLWWFQHVLRAMTASCCLNRRMRRFCFLWKMRCFSPQKEFIRPRSRSSFGASTQEAVHSQQIGSFAGRLSDPGCLGNPY